MSFTGIARALNGTTLDSEDAKTKAVLYEDKVFTIALLAVALGVVTVTGLLVCVARYKHRRRWNPAYFASARGEVPEVELAYNTSVQSLQNLLGTDELLKDHSRIYYIFSDPVPGETHSAIHKAFRHTPLTLHSFAKHPKSGIALNPPFIDMRV